MSHKLPHKVATGIGIVPDIIPHSLPYTPQQAYLGHAAAGL